MIRKLLIWVAFVGMVGSFILAVRDIHKIADRACGSGEAGGNCQGFAEYFSTNDVRIFAVFAILMAILLLLQTFKSSDR